MTGTEIIQYGTILTNTNTTTFLSGASNQLVSLNIKYGNRILDILKIGVDKNASVKEVTTTLYSTIGLNIGDVGYNGEYPFPTDLLKPLRVEVSFDGNNWKKCKVYDNPENLGSEYSDSQLGGEFSENEPRVDFTRDSYKIRPPKTSAGNIDKGIYIEYEKRQVALAASDTPLFESNLHDVLAYDLAADEYSMHPRKYDVAWKANFDVERAKAERRFNDFYKNRFKRSFRLKPKYESYN